MISNTNETQTTGVTSNVVVTNPNILQALLKVDFEILGTQLVAEYYKSGNKEYFLLMPTDESNARCITIDEMVKDISYLLGIASTELNIEELEKNIKSIGLDINEIKVILKMAYFYIIVETGTNTTTNTEYALQLEMDTSAVLPDTFSLFNIKKIGVAVWNTERTKIISQMNLYKPEDLLKEM